jgi:two-component system LytT family response regulator
MIRTLVVDDEAIARRRIRRLLGGEPDIEIVGECGDGRAAIEQIRTLRPDLVFLDVQMPEADGFEVIRAVGRAMPLVIFVTAFDQYAVAAFEVHALDYLLKPFDRLRLHDAVRRARDMLARAVGARHERLVDLIDDLKKRQRYLKRFVVRDGHRLRLIDVGDVDWIEAADNYAVLHAGRASHVLRETMARLEQALDPDAFVRLHRSVIVRVGAIRELQSSFHGDGLVVLRDGTRLNLSRTYRPRVEALLKAPL